MAGLGSGLMSGIVFVTMVGVASSYMSIPCPPAFIDMEAFFDKTIQVNSEMRNMFNNFKLANSRPENCRYSWDILGNLDSFNGDRCDHEENIAAVCTTTTKTTTSTATTSTTGPPTSPPAVKTSPEIIPPKGSTSHSSFSPSFTNEDPKPLTTAPLRPLTSSPDDNDNAFSTNVGEDRTTNSPGVDVPDTNSVNAGKINGKPVDNSTTIYISVGAGVLLIIVVISLIIVCRTRSAASGGAHKTKLQRQKSDSIPINSIQDDMSRRSSMSGDGSWRYSRSIKRGSVWRPQYSSENSSEHGSMKSSKLLIMRGESQKSVTSADFHFNTLKHLDHPNAIVLGGFGETSTDYTLTRNGGTLHNGGGHVHANVTVEVNGGEQDTAFDYDQPKLCIQSDGYDNPAMSKSSSFDSADHAIDEWKKSLKSELAPAEDDLISSQNEMMFCYENKGETGLIDLNTPAPTPPLCTDETTIEVNEKVEAKESAPVSNPTKPAKNSPQIEGPILECKEDVSVTPASNIAVVLPTKRMSVKDMKNMFEKADGNYESSTLQSARGTNGVMKNGLNNTQFHSLPRKLEKPSAHVQPQQVIIMDRDADVQL